MGYCYRKISSPERGEGFERGSFFTGTIFMFLLVIVTDIVLIGTIFEILFNGLLGIKFRKIFYFVGVQFQFWGF